MRFKQNHGEVNLDLRRATDLLSSERLTTVLQQLRHLRQVRARGVHVIMCVCAGVCL